MPGPFNFGEQFAQGFGRGVDMQMQRNQMDAQKAFQERQFNAQREESAMAARRAQLRQQYRAQRDAVADAQAVDRAGMEREKLELDKSSTASAASFREKTFASENDAKARAAMQDLFNKETDHYRDLVKVKAIQNANGTKTPELDAQIAELGKRLKVLSGKVYGGLGVNFDEANAATMDPSLELGPGGMKRQAPDPLKGETDEGGYVGGKPISMQKAEQLGRDMPGAENVGPKGIQSPTGPLGLSMGLMGMNPVLGGAAMAHGLYTGGVQQQLGDIGRDVSGVASKVGGMFGSEPMRASDPRRSGVLGVEQLPIDQQGFSITESMRKAQEAASQFKSQFMPGEDMGIPDVPGTHGNQPKNYAENILKQAANPKAEGTTKAGKKIMSVAGRLKTLDPQLRNNIEAAVQAAEKDYGIPAGIQLALMNNETHMNPTAVSPTGPRGIAQFTKDTWAEWSKNTHGEELPPEDREDPTLAIPVMANYLKYLKEQAQNLKPDASDEELTALALMSYNQGLSAVKQYLKKG